ncbi:4Fe-4S single cluster domain-containing protein [Halalkalibacterium halodurans]|uniref:4Fe-4S single cluster domain-containing protein n=1 Tax=Halalkalibacterium halodurans TaxID=86665 RepID=UPI002AAA0D9D|nr:4Fe-4S single cluster domain-containing protein [Halalkalibacterium halodurans]MDY7224436.1 4Fe-4S single cluster domain-containing protein [Halalkalibacterium halodurans]MDY7243721.1 4Fe-4S single cluster domain-containing protein [Halalkalibacterium halodurans]
MDLRIHRYLPLTSVEGPGKRFCLWVQGCSIRCEGCAVPWTWSVDNGKVISIDQLFHEIKESKENHDIEGVTFLGGEPFDQPEALGELAQKVKSLGLTVMSFSGYMYEDLKQREDCQLFLSAIDLLIDGPFVKEKLDLSRPWTGSSNQRYHFLTDKYKHLEQQIASISNKIEIRILEDGSVSVNGMATQQTLEELFHKTEFKKLSPTKFKEQG